MAKKKLRVGLIGAGGISRIHCEGWAKVPGADIVAVTDINPDAARQRAEKYDIANVDPDVPTLLDRELDLVDIVVPNRFHKPYTIDALKSGKHVLCEKPLALTAKDVDEMIAAAKKARKKLMCAQHMRFTNSARAIRDYLKKNPLGDIYYARAKWNRRRGLPTTAGFIYKKNSGGGPCLDIGVHALDLALHLMGNFEPVSVTGIAVNKIAKRRDAWSHFDWGLFDKKGMDIEDFAAGMVRFKNGAALSLECSFMLNMGEKDNCSVDLFGDKAGVSWPSGEYHSSVPSGVVDATITPRDIDPCNHHAEIAAFADCVRKDKPVPVPPEESRAVMAILDGLYTSASTGKEVRL
jgi:predicted dehydrogenase